MSLEHFHQAQADKRAGYATALAEIRSGRKCNHWIWYIFPQLDGLGRSSTARSYALRDLEEAYAYLRDPLLGTRYEEITDAVAEQLAIGSSVENLMGGSTDTLKLVSSLTLFQLAASQPSQGQERADFTRLAQRCDSILNQIADQGYPRCQFTLGRAGGRFA